MKTIENYIEENKERFLKELFELIRIPSISSEVEHKADMYKCAEKWKSLLLEAGADKAEVYETKGNPVNYRPVFAYCPGIRAHGCDACRSCRAVADRSF